MIENDDQLNQTRLAINDLESAMAALKRDVLPLNPERFAVMAEPIVDHIRELRQDDAHFEAMVNQVIEDALAGRLEPMTPAQQEAEWRELAAYGEQKAAQVSITSDEDIDRLLNQDRQERRAKNAA